ncbi:MAG: hypothetical protein JO289_13765 [Xanthobacteraceae bacterium]|nr:hypothetical protein [Xanthobacteraceae bacterium]
MHDTFKFATDDTPTAHSKFTTVDVPGANLTTSAGINDRGQIVGTYVDSTGESHGYLDTNGRFTTIDPPGATSAEASGINDRGQIVGFYSDSTGQHGFLDTNGTFKTIDVPGASATDITGINDRGQFVGVYEDSTGPHGFVDTNGSFTTLELPGTTNGPPLLPLGINDRGQIDGLFFEDRGMGGPPPNGLLAHGFLDTNGTFTTIEPPGAAFTEASGINDRGQIVGVYGADAVATHYFLDTRGTFTNIGVPVSPPETFAQAFTQPATLAPVVDINNRGQIAGTFTDSTGTHGFVERLTPDPFHFADMKPGHDDIAPALAQAASGTNGSKLDTQATNLALLGQYAAACFITAGDGPGGATSTTEPPPNQPSLLAPPHT